MKKKTVFQAIFLLAAAAGWAVYDYLALPAYSIRSFRAWMLAAVLLAAFVLVIGLFGQAKKALLASFVAFALVAGAALMVSVGDQPWWPGNAKRLAGRLPAIERRPEDFAGDFPREEGKAGFLIASYDREQAGKLAQGAAAGLKKSDAYPATEFGSVIHTRLASRDRLVYVAPLEFVSKAAALSRGTAGTPGFVEVDLEDGQVRTVEVEGGLKYGPGAVLAFDLSRRLRAKLKASIIGQAHFEIDDSGKPWWIAEILAPKAGVFGGLDLAGVALVDAVSGAVERYEPGKEPAWVDRTVSDSLAIAQAKDRLRLFNGWANYQFKGKKESLGLSEGYGFEIYSSPGDARAFLSAGIVDPRSPSAGLVGLLMLDLKAKEAIRYPMRMIDELRAMDLAGGDERARGQGLAPDWPGIDAVAGKPAYSLILKNSSQTKYAYLGASDGTAVAVADAPEAARAMLASLLGGEKLPAARPEQGDRTAPDLVQGPDATMPAASPSPSATPGAALSPAPPAAAGALVTARIVVQRVKELDGRVQFIAKGDADSLYSAPAGLSNGVRFLKAGDSVELRYRLSEDGKERLVVELRNLSLD